MTMIFSVLLEGFNLTIEITSKGEDIVTEVSTPSTSRKQVHSHSALNTEISPGYLNNVSNKKTSRETSRLKEIPKTSPVFTDLRVIQNAATYRN